MQLANVLCYIFLTITLTSSCVAGDEQKNEIEDTKHDNRIVKREATVILDDNFPMERIFQKPKVIYRRISKQRYGPPKPKYGPPKPKYRPPKSSRKPAKKPRKPSASYRYPNPKKNSNKQKPRYSSMKQRPGFGHVVKMPHYSFLAPDETGFGEPPVPYGSSFQYPKQSYGEPPVDSYGAPLKSNIKNIFPTVQTSQDTTNNFDTNDFNKQEYQSWQPDTNFALSKKQPTYSIPDDPIYVTPEPKNYEEESLDPSIHDKQILQEHKFFFRKKRPQYYSDSSKVVNRPWRPNKYSDFDDEIIVGGQYAEPPARIIPKFHPNQPMYDDDDQSLFASLQAFANGEVASSATNSPYTNYKNSNMAFSPQNLNDAFSIVDK